MKDNKYARLIRLVVKLLDGLNEEQCENLTTGKAKLIYQEIETSAPAKKPSIDTDKNREYVNNLLEFNSREEAEEYLKRLRLTKKVLIELCNMLQVHVLKNDKKDQIIEKIVETAVGAKLRTEAIKNTELKRKNEDQAASGDDG